MKDYTLEKEIKKIIDDESLVELHFNNTPDEFNVGRILDYSHDFFVSVEILPSGKPEGVWIFRTKDISFFRIDTEYLKTLNTKIDENQLKRLIFDFKSSFTTSSFVEFLKRLMEEKQAVNLKLTNGKGLEGTIAGLDAESVKLNEYKTSAQIILDLNQIENIAINVSWIKN